MEYNWRSGSNIEYYYRVSDGRALGSVWQYVSQSTIWCSKIEEIEFPFTNESQKHLGHFIACDAAKASVEKYWHIQSMTLLADK